jgi:hypothetical protein
MCAVEIDYQHSCFVIMPFGRKPVGDKEAFP